MKTAVIQEIPSLFSAGAGVCDMRAVAMWDLSSCESDLSLAGAQPCFCNSCVIPAGWCRATQKVVPAARRKRVPPRSPHATAEKQGTSDLQVESSSYPAD